MTSDQITLEALGERMANATPQAAALGLKVVSVHPGDAAMALPSNPALVGDPESGVLAGGAVTTLLDHVCGLAVSSKVMGGGTIGAIATLDLRIDYMRAAVPGREIIARANCYHVTRSIAFVRAAAFDDHNEADPVATAQAAFALSSGGERR